MRLIDADSIKFTEYINGDITVRKEAIDKMPTAYNVDNVVERLERDSQDIALIYPTDQGYDYENAIGIDINKAKEIVKFGGIE